MNWNEPSHGTKRTREYHSTVVQSHCGSVCGTTPHYTEKISACRVPQTIRNANSIRKYYYNALARVSDARNQHVIPTTATSNPPQWSYLAPLRFHPGSTLLPTPLGIPPHHQISLFWTLDTSVRTLLFAKRMDNIVLFPLPNIRHTYLSSCSTSFQQPFYH